MTSNRLVKMARDNIPRGQQSPCQKVEQYIFWRNRFIAYTDVKSIKNWQMEINLNAFRYH